MRTGVGLGWAIGRRTQKVLPSPSTELGADLAAHHVDHPPRDRQAEAEALLLARLAAAVEALEDALDLRRGNAGSGVDHLQDHLPLAVAAAANGNGAGGRRVLEGVGEQADHHLAQQRRVAVGGEIGLDLDDAARRAAAPRPRRRRRGSRPARRRSRSPPRRATRPGPGSAATGSGGSSARRPRRGGRGSGRGRCGSSLAPLLQDLDRAGDPGQRVAQLVRGVGDEVGFGELAAHLVGAVAERRRGRRARRAASGRSSRRRGRRSAAPGGRRSRPRRRGAAAAASPPAAGRPASSRRAAALLEKRTGPS